MEKAIADRALHVHRLGLATILTAAFFSSMAASAGMPIHVRVVVEEKMSGSEDIGVLGTAWDPQARSEIETRVAEKFSAHLRERFPHWDFDSVPATAYATLRLRLIEFSGMPNKIEFQLQRYLGNREAVADADVREVWRMDWLLPGDVQARRVPKRAAAPDVIAAALRRIDRSNSIEEQRISSWLAEVPLATGGRWIDPAPPDIGNLRLVVALPEDRFDPLKVSILEVSGRPPGDAAAEVRMRMKGISMSEAYKPVSGEVFPALVVCPEGPEWSARTVQNARALKIGYIFLEEFKEPVNDEFASLSPAPPQ